MVPALNDGKTAGRHQQHCVQVSLDGRVGYHRTLYELVRAAIEVSLPPDVPIVTAHNIRLHIFFRQMKRR
jgi:hypothetical protein